MRHLSQDFKIFHNADRLAERIFLALTFLFIGLIVFPSSLQGIKEKHRVKPTLAAQLLSGPSIDRVYAYHDLGDISTNVLFYIPFGLFLSLTVSFRKPRFLTLWLAVGFFLSASMEAAQYFIGRYADPVDVVTNTFGFIVGFELGVAAIRFFGLRPSAILGINPDNQTSTKINTLASIRFLYIAVYLLSSWLPFDLTFDWNHILTKLRPDRLGQVRLILDPFYHIWHWKRDAETVMGFLWGLLPVAVLTSIINGFKKNSDLYRPIVMCVVLALVAEFGQVFVYSRTSDVFILVLAVLAGVLGWLTGRVWFMLQDLQGYSSFENEKHRNDFLLFMTELYVVFLVLSALSPFRFECSARAVWQKLLFQTNWIPFHNQIGLRDIEMSFFLLRDVGAFIPLGLLITFCWRVFRPVFSRGLVIGLAAAIACVLAVVLEVIKTTGVGQYADSTLVLLATVGAVIGSVSFQFLTRPAVHQQES